MIHNISKTDRILRTGMAITLLVLFSKTDGSLTMNWLLLAGSILLLSSSIIKYCPLYHLLDRSTHPKKKHS
ncbi:DUF2892 domain-containing protein [Spirosoma aureum]|uniref:DUF2892 domain-containing protein n=1 Tax=Spirosoma aureum TaxID=2692134 RepID=A0A6G9AMW0_9BACT|nr:DUF2892 domain-containing protein [Spirosoma aureum]QIP13740.1 DUF2892 domain-containing protein [Spirosoma aureum]